MVISIPRRTVVFDYGEVISRSPSESDTSALLAVSGCDAEPFWASYWSHRDGLDQGTTSIREYWALIAADLGVTWRASKVHELWVADFRSWWSIEPATVDLIEELHDGGTRLAILSNAGFDFSSGFRYSPMGTFFERVFVSAEMDSIKPDPAIYAEVARELGIQLDEMIFIDNKSINTDAAALLGVTTHHFTNAEGLGTFLRSLQS
ncbi:HAD family phosphatase [Salinibacterium sp. G-O1]|uniref:HAD family hydrolase n=1 Tax=Salinibacterium sp. G-O1 TaxID=3046208 RepID=UPI0024B9E182|nr:HAD family phosphatase [Salinibacterium sp. G-O1]MDJ0334607.1 HAD family phosphatase [Salinibacterium sp. G-O1]